MVPPLPAPRALVLALVIAAAAIAPAIADTLYKVDIAVEGVKDSKLVDALTSASQLVSLKDHPPASNAALRRRAEEDLPRLQAVMKAEGYWQAAAAYTLDTNAQAGHGRGQGHAWAALPSRQGRIRPAIGRAGAAAEDARSGRARDRRSRAVGAGRGRQ